MKHVHVAVVVTLVSALISGARAARADEPAPPAHERWYGYQTLLVDLVPLVATPVGIVLSVNEAQADNTVLVGVPIVGFGASTYLFGAPIVHWAHGRVGMGFLSLGMRILAPLAGVGLGAVESQIATNSKNQNGIGVGAAIGALAAIVVDSAVLAREKVPDEDATKKPGTGFVPALVVSKQAFSLGLSSSF